MSKGRFSVSGQTLGPVADPEQLDDVVTLSYMEDQGYAVASAVASALAVKADLSHTHAQSDVTGLVADLAAKAAAVHTHAQSDITSLVSDLAGKAASSHTHAQSDVTNLVTALAGKAASSHTHAQADVTNLVSDLAAKAASVHTHTGLAVLYRLNADSAQSSNVTFSNLFTQAVLAGEVWSFEAILYFTAAATTTGIVTQVDSPTSPTASQVNMLTMESATALRSLPAAANTSMTGTAGLTTVLEARVSGTIEVGATPGNIIVKFRSEINASAITVKRGSWAKFYKH